MVKHKGVTLVELITFIVIFSLALTASMTVLNNGLRFVSYSNKDLKALQLAMSYMTLITVAREVNYPATPTDPCSVASPPAACQALSTYASNEGLSLNSSFTTANSELTITVTASDSRSVNAVVKARYPA
jgi:Tfp pilus assembly protein PilV